MGWNIIKVRKYWQIVLFLGWTKLFFYSWALLTCCCRRLFTHCIDWPQNVPWHKKGLSFWTCCVMLLITASLTAVWSSAIRHLQLSRKTEQSGHYWSSSYLTEERGLFNWHISPTSILTCCSNSTVQRMCRVFLYQEAKIRLKNENIILCHYTLIASKSCVHFSFAYTFLETNNVSVILSIQWKSVVHGEIFWVSMGKNSLKYLGFHWINRVKK